MSNLKNRLQLNKVAGSNEIEQIIRDFTDKLNPIVIKELESKGVETDDYERQGWNAGALALAMALGLSADFQGNGLVADELSNMIMDSIEEVAKEFNEMNR